MIVIHAGGKKMHKTSRKLLNQTCRKKFAEVMLRLGMAMRWELGLIETRLDLGWGLGWGCGS
jgi:hypothetical protein